MSEPARIPIYGEPGYRYQYVVVYHRDTGGLALQVDGAMVDGWVPVYAVPALMDHEHARRWWSACRTRGQLLHPDDIPEQAGGGYQPVWVAMREHATLLGVLFTKLEESSCPG